MNFSARHSNPVTLLVEDDEDDADLTRMAFRDARLENALVRVRDGEEALDYLFARGAYAGRDPKDLPLVVLLDLKLPRMSGTDVLRAIRNQDRTRRLPVVILTSSIEDGDRRTCYDLYCNSYVQKPINYERFVAASRDLGEYWTALNTPPPEVIP